jgi:hypothetical protein
VLFSPNSLNSHLGAGLQKKFDNPKFVFAAMEKFTIKKVLFVPRIGTNLISIAAVTNVGLSVLFIETRVTIAQGQSVIMVGAF